jgi:hypothetical protein
VTSPGTVPANYTMPSKIGSIDQRTYSGADMNRAFLICTRCGVLVEGAAVPVHNSWHTNNALMGAAGANLVSALLVLLGLM